MQIQLVSFFVLQRDDLTPLIFITASAGTRTFDTGDQFGRTPLMFCVLADRLECAELLLKAGAQVNMKDNGGRTALHWAAHKVSMDSVQEGSWGAGRGDDGEFLDKLS